MTENRHRYTDHELIERLRMVQKHKGNRAAAARAMGCASRSAFAVSIQEAIRRGLTPETRTQDAEARLKTELALLKQELTSVRREADTAESIRKEIFGLAAMTANPPHWLNPKKTAPGAPGVPVVVWSDFHWGEVISREQVGGVNEYNRKIARRRFKTLVEKTISLAKSHMVKPNYPGIVVCLGGDMIGGAIHEELAETNDGTVQQAVLECEEQLIAGLTQIADAFGRVFVPCVPGNHARDTHKPRKKNYVFHTYEWSMYCRLERHFRGDKRIQFAIPSEADCHFVVAGHRFLLTHGDNLGVKGGDGIIGSIGPIVRGTFKVGRNQSQIGRDFDTLILCHWHCYTPRSDAAPMMVNGCLKGFDEYAHLGLRVPYSRPTQALFFCHPAYGITCQWPIYLEAKQKSYTGKAWVSWHKEVQHHARAA